METIKDIIDELREHSGEMTTPQIIFDEDGGVDMSILVDRIEQAVKALEADRDNWREQALAEDARANAIQSVDDNKDPCKSFHDRSLYSVQYSYDKKRWDDVLDMFCRADDAKEWWMEHKKINSKIYQGCFSRTIKITTNTEVVSEIY